MLTQLTVSNYAIAERVELQFSHGMTALTGETGAGKSIVLDALGLAMDASGFGMGKRSQRFAMIVDDGKVTYLGVEPAGGIDVSSADNVLAQL